jgi:hypothetical protein
LNKVEPRWLRCLKNVNLKQESIQSPALALMVHERGGDAALYALIREASGGHVLLDGCPAAGHLRQGVFDLQRTGDDTLDADLVGITEARYSVCP